MFYACGELAALVMHDNFISVSHKCPVAVGCACAMNHQMHAKHSKCSYNISKIQIQGLWGMNLRFMGPRPQTMHTFICFIILCSTWNVLVLSFLFALASHAAKNVHSPNKKNITSQMCYPAI